MKARERFSARQPSQGASSPLVTGSLKFACVAVGSFTWLSRYVAEALRRDAHLQVHHLARHVGEFRRHGAHHRHRGGRLRRHHRTHRLRRDAHQHRAAKSPGRPSGRVPRLSTLASTKLLAGPRMSITVVDASAAVPVRLTLPSSRMWSASGRLPSRNSTSPAPTSASSPAAARCFKDVLSSCAKPGTIRSVVSIDCISVPVCIHRL